VVDDTGGMFVLSPADEEDFVHGWLDGCDADYE
jgi:hypothetical protein